MPGQLHVMRMFTRAANDASLTQKFLTDTNKTSNASLLLLTPLPFPFPEITIPKARFPPSVRQSSYETVLPGPQLPR